MRALSHNVAFTAPLVLVTTEIGRWHTIYTWVSKFNVENPAAVIQNIVGPHYEHQDHIRFDCTLIHYLHFGRTKVLRKFLFIEHACISPILVNRSLLTYPIEPTSRQSLHTRLLLTSMKAGFSFEEVWLRTLHLLFLKVTTSKVTSSCGTSFSDSVPSPCRNPEVNLEHSCP